MIGEQDQDDIFQGFGKVLRQRFDWIASFSQIEFDFSQEGRLSGDERRHGIGRQALSGGKFDQRRTEIGRTGHADSRRRSERFDSRRTGKFARKPTGSKFPVALDRLSGQINFAKDHLLEEKTNDQVKHDLTTLLPSIRRYFSSNEPIYYYASISASSDLFQKLRWQNLRQSQAKPLTVYSTIHDAHEHSEQNPRTKQFSLLRLEILDRNLFIYGSIQPTALQLDDPSRISFDRLWTYIFDFWIKKNNNTKPLSNSTSRRSTGGRWRPLQFRKTRIEWKIIRMTFGRFHFFVIEKFSFRKICVDFESPLTNEKRSFGR